MKALISDEYKQLLEELHSEEEWGTSGHVQAEYVLRIADKYNIKEVLDYGAGKGSLAKSLTGLTVYEYDPAIPEKAKSPDPRDLVACTDVLEHIEPEYIENVVEDLARVVKKKGYFVISLIPARAVLPDGRNAHILLRSPEWWYSLLSRYFKIDNARLYEWPSDQEAYFDTEEYPLHSLDVEVSVLNKS